MQNSDLSTLCLLKHLLKFLVVLIVWISSWLTSRSGHEIGRQLSDGSAGTLNRNKMFYVCNKRVSVHQQVSKFFLNNCHKCHRLLTHSLCFTGSITPFTNTHPHTGLQSDLWHYWEDGDGALHFSILGANNLVWIGGLWEVCWTTLVCCQGYWSYVRALRARQSDRWAHLL